MFSFLSRYATVLASTIVCVTFAVDLALPLGFAGGVPYSLACLVVSFGNRRLQTRIFGLVGVILTLAGWHLSATSATEEFVTENRILATVMIISAVCLGEIFIRHIRKLKRGLQSERKRFFEQSLDPHMVGGLDGTFRLVNPALAALLGYTSEDLCRLPFWQFVHADDRELTEFAIRQLSRGRDVSGFMNRMLTATGEIHWIEWSAPAILPEGDVFYATGRDITERLKQKAEMRRAQDFLRGTIDSLTSHICILDEAGNIVLVNRAWAAFAQENDGDAVTAYRGTNYIEVCDHAAGPGAETARYIARGIRKILAGKSESIDVEYSCHSPEEKRWFCCRITGFQHGDKRRVTVAHENITDRQRAEEQQMRYAEVIENTTDLVGVATVDGEVQFVNRAGRSLVGIDPDADLSSWQISDFHPDNVTKHLFEQAIPYALRNGAWSGELTFLTHDGQEIPAWSVIAAHRNEEGDINYLSTVSRDLRKTKAAEQHSRMLAAIVESSSEAIIGTTLDGVITSWNRAAETIYGYTEEEAVGRSLSLIGTVESCTEYEQLVDRIRYSVCAGCVETQGQRRNGETVDVALAASPILDDRNQVCGISVIASDISERKQTERLLQKQEQELQEAQERLRNVLDSTAEAIYGVDLQGNFTFANAACVKMLGYERETDLLGRNVKRLIHDTEPHEEDSEKTCFPRCRISSADEPHHIDSDILWRRDGTWFPVEFWSHPIEGNGELTGNVVTFLDITERLEAEKRLQDKEDQMRHAQRLEAVGSLAGGMAHEFNNLLQVINGYAQFAMEGLDPEDQRCGDIREIMQAGNRAAELTQQLLSFSRQQVMTAETVDLNEAVSQVHAMMQRLLDERITFHSRVPSEPARILCDRAQFQQVLINLCINAQDAMPEGGVLSVEVRYQSVDAEKNVSASEQADRRYVEISVRDTGTGMDEATRERIFDPFFTTKEVGKGTGLGLAMVYGVVTESQGTIDVISEPGAGTEFRICLPTTSQYNEGPDSESPVEESLPPSGTILVAEDEPLVSRFLERVLRESGFEVLLAATGAEATDLLERYHGRIDVLLLDAIMPQGNGTEVAEYARRMYPDIPIIFCTGYAPSLPEVAALLSEEVPVVRKPVEPDTLLRTISEAMQKTPAGVVLENQHMTL